MNDSKISKRVRKICIDRDVEKKQLATALNIAPQSFYNKLSRDNMSYEYVCKIMDLLNVEIVFRDRITGQEY